MTNYKLKFSLLGRLYLCLIIELNLTWLAYNLLHETIFDVIIYVYIDNKIKLQQTFIWYTQE